MLIFAIESSCDETACAIVKDGREVISNSVFSQIKTHRKFGGVVPEVAAREHLESIGPVIKETFEQAGISPAQIDAFASTAGPGLVGCLLVGLNAAKTLALVHNKPYIPVNHLQAHVCANFIDSDLNPPFICLLVSGGHTQVIYVKDFDNQTIVASTIDDAVGEVYDKVARLMGLPYPGGIMLDKLAQEGNPNAFKLPEAKVGEDEFSFSGLKTALLRLTQSFKDKEIPQKDICASFQERVSDTLIKKTLNLADKYGCKTIVTAGGVAANSELRKKLFALNDRGYKTYAPAMKYCTDNAAMVGSCAYFNPIKCANPLEMEVFSRA
ncbi:TPA: tRNA (adenosine(37)-N6)-threonylcarbamoyltransferase complex transferase subunit TsaD [Candidatus Galligastranaerophilus faecipullorum]|nr:tRNA (adenosine(37)-N6)-threonylcarbamoyltransferase complex transferase subunit TsaD [Candidatus Galligastranaerophilus faecipullorum]